MSQEGEAILKFVIHIDAKLSESSKQELKSMQEQKMQNISTTAEAQQAEEKDGVISQGKISNFRKDPFFAEPVADEKLKSNITEALNKLDNVALGNLAALAQNPTNKISSELMRILGAAGPEGAIVAAAIATAISAPEVLKLVVDALSKKGFPLNRDWKAYLDQQVSVGMTRELQKRKELGIDKVIISQLGNQFIPNNPHWTYDSYLNITPQRIARIGLTDRAAGVIVN